MTIYEEAAERARSRVGAKVLPDGYRQTSSEADERLAAER